MSVLRESPWYVEILEEGRQQGLERGLERGLVQGQLTGHRQDIIRLLQTRFDPAGPILTAVQKQLATIESAEQLQDLLIQAACASDMEVFVEHLSRMLAG